MLTGKTILLGITGGIAAYKAAALTSKLVQKGAEVHVIMTSSAKQFITELTLQSLSKQRVYSDTFDERDPSSVSHIELADTADLVLVAPATANILAKMAHGLADDMLSTTLLATTAPVMVAPAMNVHMYGHPAVRHNMEVLASRGVKFIEPGVGQLACGYVGKGRLEEPETIVKCVEAFFDEAAAGTAAFSAIKPAAAKAEHAGMKTDEAAGADAIGIAGGMTADGPLSGKKVVITAGGTIERIDPVRYISNDSSGKMGFALAKAAASLGADVTLVAARTDERPPADIPLIRVQSAQEMYEAVLGLWDKADIVIKAAAVADYRPAHPAGSKIKKSGETLTLELVKNIDILETLGNSKTHQLLVGFAAETGNTEAFAREKLERKNCDLIVANNVALEGAGFGSETNKVAVYDRAGLVLDLPMLSKDEVARRILELAADRLREAVR